MTWYGSGLVFWWFNLKWHFIGGKFAHGISFIFIVRRLGKRNCVFILLSEHNFHRLFGVLKRLWVVFRYVDHDKQAQNVPCGRKKVPYSIYRYMCLAFVNNWDFFWFFHVHMECSIMESWNLGIVELWNLMVNIQGNYCTKPLNN